MYTSHRLGHHRLLVLIWDSTFSSKIHHACLVTMQTPAIYYILICDKNKCCKSCILLYISTPIPALTPKPHHHHPLHLQWAHIAITGCDHGYTHGGETSGVQHHYMLTSHQHYSATIARQTQKTYSAMTAKQSHCDFTIAQNWSPSFGSDVCPDD